MMRAIFEALQAEQSAGRAVAFTLLVETRGSTPQKSGAAMLVRSDGTQVGTLGGGCVEAEVKRRALGLQGTGGAELMTFQLDNDYGWDDGLICGGRMTMLIDPDPTSRPAYYDRYRELLDAGAGFTEAIVLENSDSGLPTAARLLYDAQGQLTASTVDAPITVPDALRPLTDRPRPYVAEGISFLPHLPRCRLVIVGAGHVGQQVAALASSVDFDVWVIDDREQYCNADRFPSAQRLMVGPIEDIVSSLEVDAGTFCIIVTRGHNHDEQALFHLADTPARYVGMIGSKRKNPTDLRRSVA